MYRKIFFPKPSQLSQHLVLLAVLMAGNFIGCGEGQKDDAFNPHEVGSIRSALTYPVPASWGSPFFTSVGVECYQRYTSSSSATSAGWHYVCAANLIWTRARTVHGTMTSDSFARRTLFDIWNSSMSTTGTPYYDYSSSRRKAVEVNISFFNLGTNPAQLSFPYKYGRWDNSGSDLLTTGTDCASHSGKVRNLHVWWDRQYADIGTMGCSKADFDALTGWGSAPDIIGGLDPSYSIDTNNASIHRTFVGVRDGDEGGGGRKETLLIYSGNGSTQDFAGQQLYDFGAAKVMMFDGSGSAQLNVGGSTMVGSARPIPNALAIYAW